MPTMLALFLIVLSSKPFARGVLHAWCNHKQFGCKNKDNTMCIYLEEPFKNQCLNMVDGMASEEWIRTYWLALFNSFRDKVAGGRVKPWPTAANMKQLVWDETLEAQARRWNFQCFLERADECNRNLRFNHTQIAQIQSHLRRVRRNKFEDDMRGTFEHTVRHGNKMSESHIGRLVDEGISEVMYMNRGEDYLMGSLLFARSKYLGASLIVSGWENVNESNIMRSNSYSAPIAVNAALYRRGTPCSSCPARWSCRSDGVYPNLCALPTYNHDGQYIDVQAGRASGPWRTALIAITLAAASINCSLS